MFKKTLLVGFMALSFAISPLLASATTDPVAEIQSQIDAILAQIKSLQAQLNAQQGGSTSSGTATTPVSSSGSGTATTPVSSGGGGGGGGFCYTFTRSLSVGMGGAEGGNRAFNAVDTDVTNLRYILEKEDLFSQDYGYPGSSLANSSFTEDVAAAVIDFQTKYGIRKTGTVGPLTRAKLNALYGCRTTPVSGASYTRDTRRVSDLKQIQLALELYYDSNTSYPTDLSQVGTQFISSIPSDPSGASYYYKALPVGCGAVSNRCSGYSLATYFELPHAALNGGECQGNSRGYCYGVSVPAASTPVPVPPIPVVSDATVTINGSPTLELTYDSNNKEALLTATFKTIVTAGSSDLYLATNMAGAGFYDQSNKNSGTNSTRMTVGVGAGEKTDSYGRNYTVVAPGNSVNLNVTLTGSPREMFAGVYHAYLDYLYTLTPNSGAVYTLKAPPNSTNSKTIIGEVSPYIKSVTPVNTGSGTQGIQIKGVRFNRGRNVANVGGNEFVIDNWATADNREYTIQFSPSKQGIAAGSYPLYIINEDLGREAGKSNIVWVQIGGDKPAPVSRITVSSPASGTSIPLGGNISASWTTSLNVNDYDYYYVGIGSNDTGSILWDNSYSGLGTVSKYASSATIPVTASLLKQLAQGGTLSPNNFFIAVDAYKSVGQPGQIDDPQVAEGRSSTFTIQTSGGSSNASLSASLDNTFEDRAGIWDNFGPGKGNANQTTADWNWTATLALSQANKIKSVSLSHNNGYEAWSTSKSDIYGKPPYPLLVFNNGVQLNKAYDQSFSPSGPYPAGLNSSYEFPAGAYSLKLYGQVETPTFSGGKLTVNFTDGTSVGADIPASNYRPTAQTPLSCNNLQQSRQSYYDICRNSGFENACFNKYSGEFQGCTRNSSNDCTVNNTNATQNLLCPVASSTSQPSVTVLSPNGGETFGPGQKVTINWFGVGFDKGPGTGYFVDLYLYYPDGGTCYIGKSDAGQGAYTFTPSGYVCPNIPQTITSGKFKILALLQKNGSEVDPGITRDSSDSYFTVTAPTTSTQPTITPSQSTVASGQSVKLSFTFPSNTVKATLYLACPSGVSTRTSPEICNTTIDVTPNRDWSPIFFNSTSQAQNVVPNYHVYLSTNPNYAVGVSSQVTVSPSVVAAAVSKPLVCGSVGDVNNDNKLSQDDGAAIRSFVLTGYGFSEAQKKDADLNNDGSVSTLDITYLTNYLNNNSPLSGSLYTFPKCTMSKPLACGTRGTATALGDMNGDARISENDIESTRSAILGTTSFSDTGRKVADVNGDGNVSTLDLTFMQRYVNGTDNTLPACTISSFLVQPSITVLSPNGGTYAAGSSVEIKWSAANLGNLSLSIDLVNQFGSVTRNIANSIPNTGSYLWTPTNDLQGTQWKILISTNDRGPSAQAYSNYFTVTAPAVSTNTIYAGAISVSAQVNGSPNPGTLPAGSQATLTWTSTNANYCTITGDAAIRYADGSVFGDKTKFPTSGNKAIIVPGDGRAAASFFVQCWLDDLTWKNQMIEFPINNAAPVISSINPNSVLANVADTVTLTGSNFSNDLVINLGNGVPIYPKVSNSNGGTLVFTVPPSVSPGIYVLTVEGLHSHVPASNSVSFTVTAPSPKPLVCGSVGDVNADGSISQADMDLTRNFVLGIATPTDAQTKAADVNLSGSVTTADITLINRYILGLDTTFAACSPSPVTAAPSLSFVLNSTVYDHAGIWGNFGPGTGNVNRSSDDWNWTATLTLPSAQVIKSAKMDHTNNNEHWSTDGSADYPW